MQLSDILEENSIKAISQKTKISEANLEYLLHKKFEQLKKVKTMGFISILEREYHADLSAIRQEANDYYHLNNEDRSVTLETSLVEEKKGKSGFFLFIVFLLFAYATWYFLTQFDKKHLKDLLPFIDEATLESFVGDTQQENGIAEDLSIAKVHLDTKQTLKKEEKIDVPIVTSKPSLETENPVVTEDISSEDAEVSNNENVDNILEDKTTAEEEPMQVSQEETVEESSKGKNETIRIVPTRRLWFGMIDTKSQQRENFTISKPYNFDVRSTSWLIATSIASFSIVAQEDKRFYTDSKAHYFKIDTEGIHPLTKQEYVEEGGYRKW